MKFSSGFFFSNAAATTVECDISHLLSNSTLLLRGFARNHSLTNKGKIRKQAQILLHESGSFSDWFVKCSADRKQVGTIKCYSDGSLVEDLPDCIERGCDPSDLGIWNTKTYTTADGCRKGYTASGLEAENNACFRECNQPDGTKLTSNKKLKCVCNGNSCNYVFNLQGGHARKLFLKTIF